LIISSPLTYTPSYIVHENFLDFRFYPTEVTTPGEKYIQPEGTSYGEVTIPQEKYLSSWKLLPPEKLHTPGEVTIPSGENNIEVSILPEVTSPGEVTYPRRSYYPSRALSISPGEVTTPQRKLLSPQGK